MIPTHATALGRHHYYTSRALLGSSMCEYRIHTLGGRVIGTMISCPDISDVAAAQAGLRGSTARLTAGNACQPGTRARGHA